VLPRRERFITAELRDQRAPLFAGSRITPITRKHAQNQPVPHYVSAYGLLSGGQPTKEIPLRTALYDTRGAACAIVHLHSTHAVAMTMLPEIDPRAVLPPMTPYCRMRAGQTALVPYHRPRDPAVADAIRGLAGRYSSVLLGNHGPVVAGDTLEQGRRMKWAGRI
jgi:ribulose-5-phosphate 4-epimerase/fuculose-1-phosphate aldolase